MGKPMHFVLSQGQASNAKGFDKLNQGGKVKRKGRGKPKQRPRYFVGDKGYDSHKIRRILRRQGNTPVIPKQDLRKKHLHGWALELFNVIE